MTVACQCSPLAEGVGSYQCSRHKCLKSTRMVELCNMGARGESPGNKYWIAWEEGRGPGQGGTPTRSPRKPRRILLGDMVKRALSSIGITEERVTEWLGRPCGCAERREKLNELDAWARSKLRNVFNSNKEAVEQLEELLD